mmetsp:Transcript_26385/g.61391  ORF Transcript_26385/g.61391 Transcript_26385/m.61391 type:complete len:310 (-) Transcript_26385:441-1370(-)|eukprot:CAMPEP_0116826718 /NCGR_PEP_ID=MMETSP0418-20121206/2686_1 /TAXON_ID=1158023 /ORGANISM="Astrosyne radiata, Strain 13vi08-1A" /LENGTH=309 /DNA_ID=CAMNT_0004455387 /DNA_START=665 /DNA_END=1594 /DNA_ORIENTATION=+
MRRVVAQLHELHEYLEANITRLKEPIEWKSPHGGIHGFLESEYPELLECLSPPNESDGFTVVGHNNKKLSSDDLWKKWINGEGFPRYLLPFMTDRANLHVFWSMEIQARFAVIQEWREAILEPDKAFLNASAKKLNELLLEKESILGAQDSKILKEARVAGATMTGATKYHEVLNEKDAGAVIIEEAGKVLEARVVASMSEGTKHLILIGDHEQLHPKVKNYTPTTVSNRGYNLNCSLFERLVLSDLPSVRLRVQHRMRPEISTFVRQQTYPDLMDHECVCGFPPLLSATKNIVFFDHRNPEDGLKMET